jgi:hypothetical protein
MTDAISAIQNHRKPPILGPRTYENVKKMKNENNAVITTEEQGQDKGGRPSKFQPETIGRLLEALANGLTIRQACIAAGVGESTLSRWKAEHPELVEQLAEAREQARQKALAGIKKAGEADWRALAKFLELSFPEYRQPHTKIEVNSSAQAQEVEVVCDEPTRQAMIAAREQFLRDKSKPQPDQPKLQPGVPIGTTHAPEDPQITLMKSFEGGISEDHAICGQYRLGRYGNTD